jgi:hypothetical protein
MTTRHSPIIVEADPAATQIWERRQCINTAWCGGAWLVQPVPACSDLWRVTQHLGGGIALVAATEPACPRCGSDLMIMLELPRRSQAKDQRALKLW